MDVTVHRPEDLDTLAGLIRQATDAKQRDRYRVVELAVAGEQTLTIMRMLSRSRGFVQRWAYAYRDGGLDAIAVKRQPGRPPTLSADRHDAFRQRGAVDPLTGKSSGLIAPTVNTKLMSEHLSMIAQEAGDDTHVVLVLDGAGWHKANDLVVPANMTLLFLPPYAPELMPMERVWAWMRQHDLSNRVFTDAADIDWSCAQSWNKLTPQRLQTITATDWLTHEN